MLMSCRLLSLTSALIAAAAIVASGSAFAAKKMTYEQAYSACKTEVDTRVPKSGADYEIQRASAGGACMKRLGFKLKNPSEF